MAHEPWAELLGLWPVAALLVLLGRRDRAFLWRLPVCGLVLAAAGVAAALLGGLAGADRQPRTAFLLLSLIVAGACGMPAVLSLAASLLRLDVPRARAALRGGWRWAAACLVLGLMTTGTYLAIGSAIAARWQFRDDLVLFDSDGPLYLRLIGGGLWVDDNPVALKHPLVLPVGRGALWLLQLALPRAIAAVSLSAIAAGGAAALAADYFRRVSGSRLTGLLLAAGLAASAGHVVFGSIPETYALVAAAIVGLHWLVACRVNRWVRVRHEALLGALATGAMLTQAMTAAICFVAGPLRPLRRTGLRWAATIAILLAAGGAVQLIMFPESAAVLEPSVFRRDLGGAGLSTPRDWRARVRSVARAVLAEGVVGTPPAQELDGPKLRIVPGKYTGFQASAALGAWWSVLAVGVGTLLVARRAPATLSAALACLLLTAVLHLWYGNEHVFLYSGTFVFYLFAILAHAAAGWPRSWAWATAAALLLILISRSAELVLAWMQLCAAA